MELIPYIYDMWYKMIGVSVLPIQFNATSICLVLTWVTFLLIIYAVYKFFQYLFTRGY